jgi:hypothetical protein
MRTQLNSTTRLHPELASSPLGMNFQLNTSALCVLDGTEGLGRGGEGGAAGGGATAHCATRFFTLEVRVAQAVSTTRAQSTESAASNAAQVPLPSTGIALKLERDVGASNDPYASTLADRLAYNSATGYLQVPPYELLAAPHTLSLSVAEEHNEFFAAGEVVWTVTLRRVAEAKNRASPVDAHPYVASQSVGTLPFDAHFVDYVLYRSPVPASDVSLTWHLGTKAQAGEQYAKCAGETDPFSRSLCLQPFFRLLAQRFAATPFPTCFAYKLVQDGTLDDCTIASRFVGEQARSTLHSVGDTLTQACPDRRCDDGCRMGVMAHWASEQLVAVDTVTPHRFDDDLFTLVHLEALLQLTCDRVMESSVLSCYEAIGEATMIARRAADHSPLFTVESAVTLCSAITSSEHVHGNQAEQASRAERCTLGVLRRYVMRFLVHETTDLSADVAKTICAEGALGSVYSDLHQDCYEAVGRAAMIRYSHDHSLAKHTICDSIDEHPSKESCKDGLDAEQERVAEEEAEFGGCAGEEDGAATTLASTVLVHRVVGASEDAGVSDERQRDAYPLTDISLILPWADDSIRTTDYAAATRALSLPPATSVADATSLDFYLEIQRDGADLDVRVSVDDATDHGGHRLPTREAYEDVGALIAAAWGYDAPRPTPTTLPTPPLAPGATPPPTPYPTGPPTPPITATATVTDTPPSPSRDSAAPTALLVLGFLLVCSLGGGGVWCWIRGRRRKVVVA